MHTFFINTSKMGLGKYDELFDVHRERKTYVSMECPLSDWYDKDKGYLSCVEQMGDLIDGYMELNNAFNLILYIDLSENEAYSSIEREAHYDRAREECGAAMRMLFTHTMYHTVVSELVRQGRRPQSTLIMFGEEKPFVESWMNKSDLRIEEIENNVLRFLGFPEREKIEEIAKGISGTVDEKVEKLQEELGKVYGLELFNGMREAYGDDIRLWYETVIGEKKVPNANDKLFHRIQEHQSVEREREGMTVISCPYDTFACRGNKCVLALSQLNILLHLLKCVEANSVYARDEDGNSHLIPFYAYTADEIAPFLRGREQLYSDKIDEIESLTDSYARLGLAPALDVFDHAKFGLDEFGVQAIETTETEVDKQDKKKKKTDEESDTILIEGNTYEIRDVRKIGKILFGPDQFAPFPYESERKDVEGIDWRTPPKTLIGHAMQVRKHHLDYLKKLEVHISDVLSNYAGKSKTNKPALLNHGETKYANGTNDERPLETVDTISDKAYDSMMEQYMQFCAAQSVAVTDIEEQCNWFVSRIHQIEESLRKIKLVAIGLFVALIVLYTPFLIIQFEAIFENAVSFAVGAGSFAVPLILLYSVFTAVALAQKKKFGEAWKVFLDRSNQALAENAKAAESYDRLLSAVVPALRWVYDYKLDVNYRIECCDVADAKIEHHRSKLYSRVAAIKSILSDLERTTREDDEATTVPRANEKPDYNAAFCSGKENRAFYSIISREFLNPSQN